GELWEQVANLDAGDVGFRRPHWPGDLAGSIGLEIPHILVRRTTNQVNHDHRLVLLACSCLSFSGQQLAQRDSTQAECANLQKIAPPQSSAKLRVSASRVRQAKHGGQLQ